MDKKKTIVTIDPGASGGIGYFHNNFARAVKMPETIKEMDEFIKYLKDTFPDILLFIEKVNSYRGDEDVKDGKRFGIDKMLANYERLKTVITMNGIMFVEVPPVTWQTTLKLKFKRPKGIDDGKYKTMRKNKYKKAAENMFPEIKKVTLATSDALCLIQFALWKMENDPSWIQERLQNKPSTGLFT